MLHHRAEAAVARAAGLRATPTARTWYGLRTASCDRGGQGGAPRAASAAGTGAVTAEPRGAPLRASTRCAADAAIRGGRRQP